MPAASRTRAPVPASLSMTARGKGLLLFAVAAGVLGIWTRATPLLVAAQGTLLLLAAMAAWARIGSRGISLSRSHPGWAFEDEVLTVRLGVTNRSRLPLRWLEIEDRFPADRETEKPLCFPGPLAAGERAMLAYAAPCGKRRGGYKLGPAAVILRDPLGAFEARATAGGLTDLTVFPRTAPILRLPLAGMARWDNVDTETVPKAGSSLNFSGTREYRQGDSLKFIHWGATAHTGKLVVKEFELNVATEVSVFLDAHYYAVKGMGRESTFEYGVKAAASVARHAAARGSQVRFVCTSKRPLEIPLGRGDYHLLGILRSLTTVQPDGPEPLDRVLRRWIARIETASTVVLVMNSVKLDLKAYVEAFALLKARQVRILLVLIDDNTFLNLWENAQSKKVQALLLPDVIRLLVSMGVTVYTLAQGDDLTARFEKPYAYTPTAG